MEGKEGLSGEVGLLPEQYRRAGGSIRAENEVRVVPYQSQD